MFTRTILPLGSAQITQPPRGLCFSQPIIQNFLLNLHLFIGLHLTVIGGTT